MRHAKWSLRSWFDRLLAAHRRTRYRRRFAGPLDCLESRVLLSSIMVQNLNDSGPGSLRTAVQTANAQPGSDTIEFDNRLRGSIVLTTGQLVISDAVVITGLGAARLSVSGNNASRIFQIQPGTTVSISDLSLINGRQTTTDAIGINVIRGGAILNQGSFLTLDRVTLAGNRAESTGEGFGSANVVGGGAVANTSQAMLVARNCTFRDNTASGGTSYAFGGAIGNVTDSAASIYSCHFTQNTVTGALQNYGGAVGNLGGSSFEAQDSSFVLNRALGVSRGTIDTVNAFGGAIATRPGTLNSNSGSTRLENCRLISNRAEGAAGTVLNTNTGGMAIGGGVYSLDSSLTVKVSTIVGNVVQGGAGSREAGSAAGGGIAVQSSPSNTNPVAVSNCLVQGNVVRTGAGPAAFAQGGGLSLSGTISIDGTRVIGNVVNGINAEAAQGGGVYLYQAPFVLARDARIVGNVILGSSGEGGGLFTTGNVIVRSEVVSQPWRFAQGNVARGRIDNLVGTLISFDPPPGPPQS